MPTPPFDGSKDAEVNESLYQIKKNGFQCDELEMLKVLKITLTRPNTPHKMRLTVIREKALRTDERTDGRTDGHTLLKRCDGASKNLPCISSGVVQGFWSVNLAV